VGIEDEGFVEGAVFVLTPSVSDWMDVLSRPVPGTDTVRRSVSLRRKPEREVDPFSDLTLKASYKGYGPWRVSDSTHYKQWCLLGYGKG
jgi:hypothetical protein